MTYYLIPDFYRTEAPAARPAEWSIDQLAKALIAAERAALAQDGKPVPQPLEELPAEEQQRLNEKARRKIAFWTAERLLQRLPDPAGSRGSSGRNSRWHPAAADRVHRICHLRYTKHKSIEEIKEILQKEFADAATEPGSLPEPEIAPPEASITAAAGNSKSQRVYQIAKGISLVVDSTLSPKLAKLVPMLVRTARTIAQ